jgi:beta-lactam-binding protein with PASTA domain
MRSHKTREHRMKKRLKNILEFLKSRTFLVNIGIAVIALPLLFWSIFAWLGHYTRHNEYVIVPDFKSLKIRQLNDFVADKNVSYEIIDSIWDPSLQKGLVIKQDPDAGDSVKEGRKIYLYVTAVQSPKIEMPKLEDLSMRQAQAVCESYGLIATFYKVEDPCNGCIVKQLYKGKRIEPGTLIEKGSQITLNYGGGEDGASTSGFAVPDLVGLTFRAARGKLTDLGVEWLCIADPGVKDTLNAYVYAQEPAPARDRRIIQGSTIDLRLSTDKGKVDTTK